jgi:hypothetical protein
MLAALLVMAGTPAQQADAQTRAWLEPLLLVAKAEDASLCVDIDDVEVPAPFQYPLRDGHRGLDRLATALSRSRTVVQGVHVFRRRPEEGDFRLKSAHEHVLDAIGMLSMTEIERMRTGTLSLSSLPSSIQSRFRFAIATLGEGLGDSMLANYPNRVGLRLVLEPVSGYNSRTGDGLVTLRLLEEPVKVAPPENVYTEPAPLGRPEGGELDFGDGAIFTLSEICTRADVAFKRAFWHDGRLAKSRYFVSGRFTQDRLAEVLAAVTETVKVEPEPEDEKPDFPAERQKLIATVFGPHSDEPAGVGLLTIGDLVAGKPMTVAEVYGTKVPNRVIAFLNQYRVPHDEKGSVMGEFYLAVGAPGLATLYGPELDGTGRRTPYSLPHFIKVAF